jgi:hypothetical protein
MMYSRLGYPCSRTERIVSLRNWPWLKEGVRMPIRGQAELLSIVLCNCSDSSVQGQPFRSLGGGGSLSKVEPKILRLLALMFLWIRLLSSPE